MATTTNYSWTTPDDTALVKDGAAAIRTLGSSIDTTTKNLNPSTTAGDIEYRSSTPNVNTRLPLGTAGQVLKVNSGATAPEWATDASGMTNPMTTTGDTIYSSSGSTPARLGIGTAGQVLQVNSGATAPEWTTPAGGGWTLIATATPSSATTVSFTSIPTTYTNLHVVHRSIQSVGGNYFSVRFNNDSTGKYFQVFHSLGGNTTASNNGGGTFGDTSVIGNNNPQYNSPIPTSESGSGAGATGYSGIFTVFDYASTTNRRIYEWRSTGLSTVGDGYIRSMGEGYYNETATAITRLDFIRSSTQTINGQFFLYGEK